LCTRKKNTEVLLAKSHLSWLNPKCWLLWRLWGCLEAIPSPGRIEGAEVHQTFLGHTRQLHQSPLIMCLKQFVEGLLVCFVSVFKRCLSSWGSWSMCLSLKSVEAIYI
jgi:hypothetical protein